MKYTYPAKTICVLSHNEVEFNLQLGFGISKRDVLRLEGYSVPEGLEAAAKSCLILLIGGHRAMVEVADRSEPLSARVLVGGYTKFGKYQRVVHDQRLTDVCDVMRWARSFNFDADVIAKLCGKT